MIEPKPCGHCGVEMTPKVYPSGQKEDMNHFAVRIYCSRGCQNRARKKPVPRKFCETCDEEFYQWKRDGKIEAPKNFTKRRFCSHECKLVGRAKDAGREYEYKKQTTVIESAKQLHAPLLALNASVIRHGTPPRHYA